MNKDQQTPVHTQELSHALPWFYMPIKRWRRAIHDITVCSWRSRCSKRYA